MPTYFTSQRLNDQNFPQVETAQIWFIPFLEERILANQLLESRDLPVQNAPAPAPGRKRG